MILLENQLNAFQIHKIPKLGSIAFLYNLGNQLVNVVMQHAEIQKLMKSKEQFDICILEIFHANALSVSVVEYD